MFSYYHHNAARSHCRFLEKLSLPLSVYFDHRSVHVALTQLNIKIVELQNLTRNLTSKSMTGAEALGLTLKESSNFSFVSLEWNQIECDGASYLAEALTYNTNLMHLDLRNNNIADDGAFALVKALASNDTLKTLDLRWNQVGKS